MSATVSSHHQATPMRFEAVVQPYGFAEPCYVCVSHRHNEDGYLYKTWSVEGRKVREPFYRFMLRSRLGWEAWPKAYEADHSCNHRWCCNPSHLRPVERSDHKRVTNAKRYAHIEEAARCYWLATGCTGTELGKRFSRDQGTGNRWIRKWKAEDLAA